MLLNGLGDKWAAMSRQEIEKMDRQELQNWLEFRGFAVYDDEPTVLLRDCALEDYDNELGG